MWQTIETAPKNEVVLVVCKGKVLAAHYKLEWDGWQAEMMHDDQGMIPTPTHWMPLPDAPEK